MSSMHLRLANLASYLDWLVFSLRDAHRKYCVLQCQACLVSTPVLTKLRIAALWVALGMHDHDKQAMPIHSIIAAPFSRKAGVYLTDLLP